jgi:hypothetical protein
MSDTGDEGAWLAKCEQMAEQLEREAAKADRQEARLHLMTGLEGEDEQLTGKLCTLLLTLERWSDDFDDHEDSHQRGVLIAHRKAEQRLTDALLDVIEYAGLMHHLRQPKACQAGGAT